VVERDSRAPGRQLIPGEKVARVVMEVVSGRSEMVVDDVEHDAEPAPVGGVDEGAQVLRTAIGSVGREGQHTIIAPVASPHEVRHRHDLEGREASPRKMVELFRESGEGSLVRRGADMDLGDNRLMPWPYRHA